MQLSPRNSNFRLQAFAAAGFVFLLGTVAFLPQAAAGNLAGDPNALQKIQQFIDKPAPTDLLLKPKIKKKQAKDAKN